MTAAMPLDVIRTRLVAQGRESVVYTGSVSTLVVFMCWLTGVTDAIPHIWKTEGVVGYFRGWVPGIAQIAPFTGLQFALYNLFFKLWTNVWENHENYGALIAGASSGTVAKTVRFLLFSIYLMLYLGSISTGYGKTSVASQWIQKSGFRQDF